MIAIVILALFDDVFTFNSLHFIVWCCIDEMFSISCIRQTPIINNQRNSVYTTKAEEYLSIVYIYFSMWTRNIKYRSEWKETYYQKNFHYILILWCSNSFLVKKRLTLVIIDAVKRNIKSNRISRPRQN